MAPSETNNVLKDGLRNWRVEYPNGAQLGFERGDDSASGHSNNLDDRLSRITGLDWDTDGAGTTYGYVDIVEYQHNGTSRLASVDNLLPDVRREMFDATNNNDYDAWDRFGRTETQQWEDYTGAATTLDQVDYTYDFAGNRLTRNVNASTNDTRDQKYDYDGLHRLRNVEGGTYNTGTTNIDTRQLEQDWTLDQMGNWSTFKERDTDTGSMWDLDQSRAHNEVNEIDDGSDNGITTTTGTDWIDPVHDDAGNMTTIPQPNGPNQDYTLTYDAWNRLVNVDDDGEDVQINQYDGLNRRIIRDETGGSGVLTHFCSGKCWRSG